jgi:DNA-binding IclR family transcriptional regulator
MSTINRSPSPDEVQSVARALDLLEVFLTENEDLTLTKASSALGMNKATAHRILNTLESRGYVQRSPDQRKYSLGVKVFELGSRFQNQMDIRRAATPEMTSLVQQTGEAAFLCVRDGDHALCLERVEGRHRVRIFALGVGERQPLHAGAAPRALLFGMSDQEIRAYATRTKLPNLTERTLTSYEELRADAHLTSQRGYVVSYEDACPGIAAVGSPVFNQKGQVIASISVSGISTLYTPQRIEELSDLVRSAARRLSHKMGFMGERR